MRELTFYSPDHVTNGTIFDMAKFIAGFHQGQTTERQKRQRGQVFCCSHNNTTKKDLPPLLDTAITEMSGAMIRHLADKVSSSTKGTTAELRLQFSH
jgi:aminoglycoside phosphotransferase family enzyme